MLSRRKNPIEGNRGVSRCLTASSIEGHFVLQVSNGVLNSEVTAVVALHDPGGRSEFSEQNN